MSGESGVAELQPAGAEWRVRWLRGTADLNRQGSGTTTARVLAVIAERGNLVIGSSPAPPPTAERESGAGGSASSEGVQPFLALRSARDSSATRRR